MQKHQGKALTKQLDLFIQLSYTGHHLLGVFEHILAINFLHKSAHRL